QRSEVTHWRRPGKNEGVSATTNYAGSGLLYVFTSNGAPFEADTAYTAFAAYTLLTHRGDFSAAAQALQAHGYGVDQRRSTQTSSAGETASTRPYRQRVYARLRRW